MERVIAWLGLDRWAREWREVAARHGLEVEVPWLGRPRFAGCLRDHELTVELRDEEARIRVAGTGLPAISARPQGVAETLRQAIARDPDPQVGDAAFDAAYQLDGPVDALVLLLANPVRQGLLEHGASFEVAEGDLVLTSSDAGAPGVDALLGLATQLLQEGGDRLATEPVHGVRRNVLAALGRRLLPAELAPALVEPDARPGLRAEALERFLDAGGSPAAIPLVLGNARPPALEAILDVVCRRGVPDVEPAVVALLDVRERAVARAAARALGRIGTDASVPALKAAADRGIREAHAALEAIRGHRTGSLSLPDGQGGEVAEVTHAPPSALSPAASPGRRRR